MDTRTARPSARNERTSLEYCSCLRCPAGRWHEQHRHVRSALPRSENLSRGELRRRGQPQRCVGRAGTRRATGRRSVGRIRPTNGNGQAGVGGLTQTVAPHLQPPWAGSQDRRSRPASGKAPVTWTTSVGVRIVGCELPQGRCWSWLRALLSRTARWWPRAAGGAPHVAGRHAVFNNLLVGRRSRCVYSVEATVLGGGA